MYEELYSRLLTNNVVNGMVWNNVAICRLHPSVQKNKQQCLQLMYQGLEMETGHMPESRRNTIRQNFENLKRFDPSDGYQFQGTLMW